MVLVAGLICAALLFAIGQIASCTQNVATTDGRMGAACAQSGGQWLDGPTQFDRGYCVRPTERVEKKP
jgi:hypothetical protein